MRLGVLASHPIQYQAPLFRELSRRLDLQVLFAHRQSPQQQAKAGFGVDFDWDIDLLQGYRHEFMLNRAAKPGVDRFSGCDTPEISERIRCGRFDAFLVTGWYLKSYWQAVQACNRMGVPVMVRGDSQLLTPRNPFKHWLKSLIYPNLLRRFDAALYVGQRNRDYLMHYGMPDERLFFAPHCVDTGFFNESARRANRAATRTEWGVSVTGQAVLFAGKLVGVKRATDLINAVAILRSIGMDVSAVVAGDGELRAATEFLSQRLGVPTTYMGFCNQTELPAIYASADALVLPSESETWGLVVNEALASGTPCVVSDACGCAPDLIVPGVTGETFPVGDVPALARALEACLKIPRASSALSAHSEAYSVSAAADGVEEACHWLRFRCERGAG